MSLSNPANLTTSLLLEQALIMNVVRPEVNEISGSDKKLITPKPL